MLEQITLTNFRKHEDLVLTFGRGLNAIKGRNEVGKSTVYQAISYAWFGARGLKESLASVVTYSKPESSLKVVLTFTLDKLQYTLKRSKSGAELSFGTDTVTGQGEVTKYMEKLLGCSADVASKLMMANQEEIKGSLAEGATASVKLIEVLADFNLVDTILQLVESTLPSGNTKLTEARVAQLKIDTDKQVSQDLSGLELDVATTTAETTKAQAALETAKAELEDLAISEARQVLVDHARMHDKIEVLKADLAKVVDALAIPLPPQVDMASVAGLREKAAAKKVEVAALTLYRKLQAAGIEPGWEGDYASFEAEVERNDATLKALGQNITDSRVALTKLEGQIISQEACALCGKEMKDIPEVAKINNALYPQVEALRTRLSILGQEQKAAADHAAALRGIAAEHAAAVRLYIECGNNITLDTNTVPATYTWVGPAKADETDYASQIAQLEAADRLYTQRLTQQESNTTRKIEMQSSLDVLTVAITGLPLEDAADTIRLYNLRNAAYKDAEQAFHAAASKGAAAQAALRQVKAVMQEQQKRFDALKADLAKAEGELDAMVKNNLLVKKLRNARPKIADKLWAIVLSSVSHYFSRMRGVASVVTRTEEGFLVNGRSVTGLSGSTQDILGLAIRVALTRTFLPNAQFLCLDEPAAGCDSERETAMLGLVTACDFDQVLLITHSDLADAFAANVIAIGDTA